MDTPPAQQRQPGRVDELDGLRGLLALWVAVAHIFSICGFMETNIPRPFSRLQPAFMGFIEASAAVDTFIILSGFAISFLLHKRRQSYGSFMTGRVFRIYPVYLCCLVLSIAASRLIPFIMSTVVWRDTIYFVWIKDLLFSESTAFGTHVFWHLTLLNGLLPESFLKNATGTLLTPAWSITLEWQYYLVAPFVARMVRSASGMLALTAVAFLGMHFSKIWQNPQLAFFPAHLPLFLLGIGSYHFYACFGGDEKSGKIRNLAITIVIAVGILLQWHAVALVLWGLGFGCILARGTDPFARALAVLRKVLLAPLLQRLGKISFPLYLVHWPVIFGILYLVVRQFPAISSVQAATVMLVIGLPVILVMAQVMHLLVEMPGMALGKKVGRRGTPAIQPQATAEN
ncbi:MAG: acyltransferase [Luteolibacter sp.]|uniref:acyltransferase family protein n=1 Tax=Luteolibacter sp. TaxID=1962973 RepID=UPI003262D3B2